MMEEAKRRSGNRTNGNAEMFHRTWMRNWTLYANGTAECALYGNKTWVGFIAVRNTTYPEHDWRCSQDGIELYVSGAMKLYGGIAVIIALIALVITLVCCFVCCSCCKCCKTRALDGAPSKQEDADQLPEIHVPDVVLAVDRSGRVTRLAVQKVECLVDGDGSTSTFTRTSTSHSKGVQVAVVDRSILIPGRSGISAHATGTGPGPGTSPGTGVRVTRLLRHADPAVRERERERLIRQAVRRQTGLVGFALEVEPVPTLIAMRVADDWGGASGGGDGMGTGDVALMDMGGSVVARVRVPLDRSIASELMLRDAAEKQAGLVNFELAIDGNSRTVDRA